jgi:acyl-ACP thioesterase
VISTWPASIEKGVFIRCGKIESGRGEPLVEWTSLWVLYDGAARKILKPAALPVQLDCAGMRGVETTADKINPDALTGGELISEHVHTVSFSETDSNMHMNNTYYGDMTADAVYGGPGETPGEWKRVQINYLTEAKAGERIKIRCVKTNGVYIAAGAETEKKVFVTSVGV